MTKTFPHDPAIATAAADWIARLHACDCTPGDVQHFRNWLALNMAHEEAFERASEIWDLSGSLSGRRSPVSKPGQGASRLARRAVLAGLCATAFLDMPWRQQADARDYHSDVGECSTLMLHPGIQVTLNTDTHLVCRQLESRLDISLSKGELTLASTRPGYAITLTAGSCRIRPRRGSQIEVRHTDGIVAVTALSGLVLVARRDANDVVLLPGDRLRVRPAAMPSFDRPDLDDLAAWRSGRVVFRATPLAAAIAEMNRYSTNKLSLSSPTLNGLTISGLFRAGDNPRFAQALSLALPVRVRPGGTLVLVPA